MTLVRACALVLTLAVTGGAVEVTGPSSKSAFALAMLRRDGVLVPFAVNDGGKWSSPWPVPKYQLEAPLAFADISRGWWGQAAPATTWTAWPTGRDPVTVHVTGPVVFVAQCLSNVGLRTDYRPADPLPPPGQQHHPKDGVATTGTATIEPVEVLNDGAPEWSATLEILKTAIEKAELRAAKTADRRMNIFGWPARPATVPLKLEVLCRSVATAPGRVVFYFEAARQFPPIPWMSAFVRSAQGDSAVRSGLGLDIFSQGFVTLDGKAILGENIVTTITSAERVEIDYGLPLGTITVNGRLHWIMHWSGRGRERYTIIEIGEKGFKRVVDVPGGAC